MYLFFDTETTGFYNFKAAPTDPSQPKIVQLAALLVDDDALIRSSINVLINPGVKIPPEASNVHGITNEVAAEFGMPVEVGLLLLAEMAKRAHQLVAHNINFDAHVVRSEFARSPSENLAKREDALGRLPVFCTMIAATPYCRLPKAKQRHETDYKWPSLVEAHQFFFGEPFDGAHDALADARACMRVFFELKRRTQ